MESQSHAIYKAHEMQSFQIVWLKVLYTLSTMSIRQTQEASDSQVNTTNTGVTATVKPTHDI